MILDLVLLTACGVEKGRFVSPGVESGKSSVYTFIADPKFEKGIHLKGAESGIPVSGQVLYPFGTSRQQPVWELAEWSSRHLLHQSQMINRFGMKIYENEAKRISFERKAHTVFVRLDVNTSEEYDHPRRSNEPWTHLLMEQEFVDKKYLKDMDKLILCFEGRLTQCESAMPDGIFDPALHTAQFQLFLVVQNRNPQSPKYGDFLWFGIPFFDYRFKKMGVYAAQDKGKDDATGKFIYSLATEDFMQGSFHDKEWIRIEQDLKPFILDAVSLAKDRGYLTGSSIDDLAMSGMNLGWEVPGIFKVGFEFREFDLIGVPISN